MKFDFSFVLFLKIAPFGMTRATAQLVNKEAGAKIQIVKWYIFIKKCISSQNYVFYMLKPAKPS
jgi:hypothetical protein